MSKQAEEEDEDVLVREVKYSLRELMAEVEVERSLSEFAREAVDQEEISKLFERKRTRGKDRRASR